MADPKSHVQTPITPSYDSISDPEKIKKETNKKIQQEQWFEVGFMAWLADYVKEQVELQWILKLIQEKWNEAKDVVTGVIDNTAIPKKVVEVLKAVEEKVNDFKAYAEVIFAAALRKFKAIDEESHTELLSKLSASFEDKSPSFCSAIKTAPVALPVLPEDEDEEFVAILEEHSSTPVTMDLESAYDNLMDIIRSVGVSSIKSEDAAVLKKHFHDEICKESVATHRTIVKHAEKQGVDKSEIYSAVNNIIFKQTIQEQTASKFHKKASVLKDAHQAAYLSKRYDANDDSRNIVSELSRGLVNDNKFLMSFDRLMRGMSIAEKDFLKGLSAETSRPSL